jgi:hypothetical protein
LYNTQRNYNNIKVNTIFEKTWEWCITPSKKYNNAQGNGASILYLRKHEGGLDHELFFTIESMKIEFVILCIIP